MNRLTLLNQYLRYPLIGILICVCGLFYFRKLEGPPFPVSPTQAAELCGRFPDCKSLTLVHRYDPSQHRLIVAIRLAIDRKQRKTDMPEQILSALDSAQSELRGLQAWGWTGRRLETRYE